MRKIAAHYIFPIVDKPIKNGALTLSDEGEILAISGLEGEEESVEFYNGILCPGFVNAHCHLELSSMLGSIPQYTSLFGFIQYMNSREHPKEQEQISAILKADNSMFADGIIAVGDISNTSVSFDIKVSSPISYRNFIEVYGSNSAIAESHFNRGTAVVAQAMLRGLKASLTPHAPYSMSDMLLDMVVLETKKSSILSIHNQESKDENEYFINGKGAFSRRYAIDDFVPPTVIGKPSIYRILDKLKEDIKLLLIHNIYTSAEDYDAAVAKNKDTHWVLCPNSNLYIEKQLPPVDMLRQKSANIAIGTDSLASNTALSILEELKTIGKYFRDVSLEELLAWATMGGAKALGFDEHIGSFEIGKKPHVVLIDGVDFNAMQLTDDSKVTLLTRP
ncbi:MAG: amidohydrolase family protein [Prevotellaceae bacterium]|jgi:cytosine/adenosine deaminase-related metal-dependent hydrolase|nr:amidohydrolase family protein [Prevotellaceae bacterium]